MDNPLTLFTIITRIPENEWKVFLQVFNDIVHKDKENSKIRDLSPNNMNPTPIYNLVLATLTRMGMCPEDFQ